MMNDADTKGDVYENIGYLLEELLFSKVVV